MNLFLSYTSRDREKLRPLLDGLHRLRHTVWFDQELEGGQQWWEAILERIRQADAFLLAVSPAFIESEACGLELEYARALSKPVLPVMVERARPELLPPSLAAVQIVDFCEPDGQAAFTLTSALAHLAPAPPLPEPLPEPPAVPISYLSGLSERIQSPTLSLDEQLSLVAKLKLGLTRPGEREAVVELIRRLKGRDDLYHPVAQELATIGPRARSSVPRATVVAAALVLVALVSSGAWLTIRGLSGATSSSGTCQAARPGGSLSDTSACGLALGNQVYDLDCGQISAIPAGIRVSGDAAGIQVAGGGCQITVLRTLETDITAGLPRVGVIVMDDAVVVTDFTVLSDAKTVIGVSVRDQHLNTSTAVARFDGVVGEVGTAGFADAHYLPTSDILFVFRGTIVVTPRQPHRLVLSVKGQAVRMWFDGKLVGSGQDPVQSPPGTTAFYVDNSDDTKTSIVSLQRWRVFGT